MSSIKCIKSPISNRMIKVGGPTYKKLKKKGVSFKNAESIECKINRDTGRPIKVGGATYNRIYLKEGKILNPLTNRGVTIGGQLYKKLVKEGWIIEQSGKKSPKRKTSGKKSPVKKSPKGKGRKSKKRDPTKPKGKRSAWIYYRTEKAKVLKEQNPGVKFGVISKQLSIKWKSLSESKKQKYINLAKKDAKRNVREMKAWRIKNGE